jgi:hypothetical protein
MVLWRGGFAPVTAWGAATLLGAADEQYQFLFLRQGRPDPLDWNDIVLNAIGAAIGIIVLLHLGIARAEPPRHSWILIGAAAAPVILVALFTAPPVFSPFYSVTPAGLRSHIMSPAEGLIIVASLWLGLNALIGCLARGSAAELTPSA